jgi:hypothetical protein
LKCYSSKFEKVWGYIRSNCGKGVAYWM